MNQDESAIQVRDECLTPFGDDWLAPTAVEVREMMRRADLTGAQTAKLCGLGKGGDRTVRRWISGPSVSTIPYSAWALLCFEAGHGIIWKC